MECNEIHIKTSYVNRHKETEEFTVVDETKPLDTLVQTIQDSIAKGWITRYMKDDNGLKKTVIIPSHRILGICLQEVSKTEAIDA